MNKNKHNNTDDNSNEYGTSQILTTIISAVIITLFSFGFSLAYKYVNEQSYVADIGKARSGDAISYTEAKINVSAEVLELIGFEKIYEQGKIKYFVVFGNYSNGFVIINNKSGEILYNDNRMPADGILIEVRDINNQLYFLPKY